MNLSWGLGAVNLSWDLGPVNLRTWDLGPVNLNWGLGAVAGGSSHAVVCAAAHLKGVKAAAYERSRF